MQVNYSGAVAGGARGGGMAPPIVETRRKIVNVVGNCQSCRRGGGGGDLKCCRPENFLVCRKTISVCRKSTALGPPPPPPPPLKHWSYGATGQLLRTFIR